MARRLNQILAVEKGIKKRAEEVLTEYHKATQKGDLLEGFNKTYKAVREGDVGLAAQSKTVQYTSDAVFKDLTKVLSELFNVTAAKDLANCTATAVLQVGDQKLTLPATYLLFLDKKLTDLHTFVSKFAELDGAVSWTKDSTTGMFRSESSKTVKTEKEQTAIVMYDATPVHPAQTQLITKDVTVGHWDHVRFSGALDKPRKSMLLERILKLQGSVKEALEEANLVQVVEQSVGDTVLGYIFA